MSSREEILKGLKEIREKRQTTSKEEILKGLNDIRERKQITLTEETSNETVGSKKNSAPQTIQQKMDALWEEEKQPVSNPQPNKPTTVSTSDVLNLGKGPLSNQGLNNLISTRQVLLNKDNGTLTNNPKYTNNSTKLMPIQQMEDNIERFNTDKEYKQNTVNRIKEKNAKVAEEGSFGNVAKKTLATPVAALGTLGTGVLKGGESILDFATLGINKLDTTLNDLEGKVIENIGKATNIDFVREYGRKKQHKAMEQDEFIKELVGTDLIGDSIGKANREFAEEYTYLPQKAGQIIETVGGMLVPIGGGAKLATKATTKIGQKALGLLPFAMQAGGGASEQAIKEGASYEDALNYGIASGTIEAVIEGFSGGIGGTVGNKVISKMAKSKIGKEATKRITNNLIGKYALKLADAGIDVAGEGFEEVLSAYADPFIKRLTYDEQAQMATSEELTESFWDAVFASMLLKGGQAGFTQIDNATSNKVKQQEQPIQINIENYKNNSEYAKYMPTNQTADNNIKISNTTLDNVVNTQNLLSGINENIKNNQSVDIKNKTAEEIKSEYEKLVPTQKNGVPQTPYNALNNVDNQIIPNESEVAQNGNMEQTAQSDKVMDTLLGKKSENVNNIAKNDVLSYTNNRGDINGEFETGGTINRNSSETGIVESEEEDIFSFDKYKSEEKRIREQPRLEYDESEKIFANNFKKKYGRDAFIFDDTNTDFGGGVSVLDNNTVLFGRNALRDYGQDFLEGHEVFEIINKQHKDIADKEIKQFINKVQEDNGFGDVFLAYIGEMKPAVRKFYIDKPQAIAKEIIGDLHGITKSREDINETIFNKLDANLVKEIQEKINNFEKQIFNTKADKQSAFSMPETDNQGRKLSTEQQEFFKDSKVRDEEGRLLEVYHGTNEGGFTIFDVNKLSRETRTSQYGKGFYFTDRQNLAKAYMEGENSQLYSVYLDIKNPFTISWLNDKSHNLNRNSLKRILLEGDNESFYNKWIVDSQSNIEELGNLTKEDISKMSKEEKVELFIKGEYDRFNDQHILKELVRAFNNNSELIDSMQRNLGYDGIIVEDKLRGNQYIAFNSSQIKNVDNTKPTEDPDINLFASSESSRPYMDLNRYISTNNESKTNKVSLTDIQNAINDIVTVKTGKFRQQAYGIYKNKGEIIRLKQTKDIPVALHELTHHLDKKYNLSSSDKAFKELEKLAVVRKNAPKQTVIKEGVAEFGRYYMTNKEYAKEIAPFYYDAFERALNNDSVMKDKVENIRQMVSDYLDQSPLNRFLSNIDKGDNEVSLWDDIKNKLIEAKRSFRKNFVDDLDPLKNIINDITNGEKLSANEDAHKLLRLNKGVTGRVRVALEYGIVDSKGNKIGKGLKEIIEPVADDIDGFIAYISALRANDLQAEGIETGFNKKDIEAVLKMYEGNKTFENASKELYKFQNQILEKTLIQSGIITREAMEAYNKNNPHYVPFYRVMDENFKQSKSSMSKVPKKIKGSTRDIINPLESIIKNTYSYMQLAEKNNAHKALFNLANKFDGTGKWFDQVPTDMIGTKITAEDVKDILEQLNLDEDVDYNEVFTTIFRPANNQKGNIVTVMDNGKPIHYEINDKELYDILTSANSSKDENGILKAMNRGATVLRVGATHSPEFILRNPIRDTIDAGIYSKNDFIPFVDTIAGIFEIAGRSDLYYKWLESGASGSTYTNAQRKALRNTLEELIPQVTDSKKNKIVDILVNTAKHPLKTYLNVAGNISNIMEEGTRVGEFKKALKNTKNLKESALESRSITVDFSRGGKQAKELNKYIAFLNAEIQGLDKMFSSFHDRPVATTLKGLTYLTIPSMIIRALQDDDEMDKVPQWEKDTYWVFFAGDTPIKIPKPQGLGQLFATVPERLVDFLKTQDKDAFDGLLERMITSYMPLDSTTSLLPTAWQPFIENATNYSFFRQQPIVKQSLQNRSPKYQYDENTSTIAKTVGGAFNISPKKIDNLISGYGGNLGKDIANLAGMPIDMVNILVNGGKKEQEYNTVNSTLKKIPLVKGFIASDTASKELDKFYEEKSKVNTLYTDTKFKYSGIKLNSTQEKELKNIQELNKLYNSAYNDIKEINEQIDEVEKSKIRNEDKKQKIDKLEKEIEKIAINLEKESKNLKESIPSYK